MWAALQSCADDRTLLNRSSVLYFVSCIIVWMVGIRTVCPTVQFLARQTVCLAVQFSYYWLILAIWLTPIFSIVHLPPRQGLVGVCTYSWYGWMLRMFTVAIRDDSFLHLNHAIVVYFDYFVRYLVLGVITKLGQRVRAVENLLSYFIFVGNSPWILLFVVLVNKLLFPISDKFPIRFVFYI